MSLESDYQRLQTERARLFQQRASDIRQIELRRKHKLEDIERIIKHEREQAEDRFKRESDRLKREEERIREAQEKEAEKEGS